MERRKPLVRKTPLRNKTRIKPIGKKQRKDRLELAAVRAALFDRAGQGRCEVTIGLNHCIRNGEVVHHVRRRSQGGDNSLGNLLWVCCKHHDIIHLNPAWAADQGYLQTGAPDDQSN